MSGHRHSIDCIEHGRLVCGHGNLRSRAVSVGVLEAAEQLSELLCKARVHHAFVGGLAVNEYGYERATTDIDLLVLPRELEKVRSVLGRVSPQSFPDRKGGLAHFHGLTVDLLYVGSKEKPLEEQARIARSPIVAAGPLFYLKLRSRRLKDSADLVELLKRDLQLADDARVFLRRDVPQVDETGVSLARKLQDAIETAQKELERR